jgi:uncharacterized protein YjbK
MHVHDEIELKWAVDAAGYAALASRLGNLLEAPRHLSQDNRFFDTPDRRLRQARMNLRLRRENGRVLMTCKQKAQETAAGLSHHHEWEEWVDTGLFEAAPDAAWRAALPLPEGIRGVLGDAPLEALGGFSNHRLEYRHRRDGVEELLCLDRTTFGRRLDHELEIETTDPFGTHEAWKVQLAAWGIPWHPQPLTKFARFLAHQQG